MLADHQEGLAKTYSETRSVASERAELAALDKALREREQEITKKTMRVCDQIFTTMAGTFNFGLQYRIIA